MNKSAAPAFWHRPLPNSYWVIPGRLLAGEHPAAAGPERTAERLRRLKGAGINCYIDLTEEGEQPEYRHWLARRDEHLRLAIADTGIPNNVADTQKLLARIRAALARGRSVYVHCRAGIGRTGLVMGCYLAEEAGDGNAAIAKLNSLWRYSARSMTWPQIPQTPEQADYIRCWPRLSKAAPEEGRARTGWISRLLSGAGDSLK